MSQAKDVVITGGNRLGMSDASSPVVERLVPGERVVRERPQMSSMMTAPAWVARGGRGLADIQRSEPDAGVSRQAAGERDAQAGILDPQAISRGWPQSARRRPRTSATGADSSGKPKLAGRAA